MNQVFLLGNLTRDPLLRYTPGGTALAEFGLAVDRRARPASDAGQAQEKETCFVEVLAWDEEGRRLATTARKGELLFVFGRLREERWKTREGEPRSRLRVEALSVHVLAKAPLSEKPGDAEGPF